VCGSQWHWQRILHKCLASRGMNDYFIGKIWTKCKIQNLKKKSGFWDFQ
jgi:hypothetical protein